MTLEQRAARHYPNNPTYQQAWLRIVTLLGERWLLAQSIQPKDSNEKNTSVLSA